MMVKPSSQRYGDSDGRRKPAIALRTSARAAKT
jgi:hypothetical protein